MLCDSTPICIYYLGDCQYNNCDCNTNNVMLIILINITVPGAKLVSRPVTPSRAATPTRLTSSNKTITPTRSSSLESGSAYKAKTPSVGKVNMSVSAIQAATDM